MKIDHFIWLQDRLDHIAEHGVNSEEMEDRDKNEKDKKKDSTIGFN